VVQHGATFDQARLHAQTLATEQGLRYVHSGNEPDLIAGVGTYALEMMEQEPDLDAVFVPVGGGSGAAGCCTVFKAGRGRTQVIGVQSSQAPAAYWSWKEGRIVARASHTFAEGLATGVGFELPQQILARHLDDFVLVGDRSIRAAIAT